MQRGEEVVRAWRCRRAPGGRASGTRSRRARRGRSCPWPPRRPGAENGTTVEARRSGSGRRRAGGTRCEPRIGDASCRGLHSGDRSDRCEECRRLARGPKTIKSTRESAAARGLIAWWRPAPLMTSAPDSVATRRIRRRPPRGAAPCWWPVRRCAGAAVGSSRASSPPARGRRTSGAASSPRSSWPLVLWVVRRPRHPRAVARGRPADRWSSPCAWPWPRRASSCRWRAPRWPTP